MRTVKTWIAQAKQRPTHVLVTIGATLTGLIATTALIVAIIALTNQYQNIQTSRHDAARDTCYLLRGLVYAATKTAPASRASAKAYINSTNLKDCNAYADQLGPYPH